MASFNPMQTLSSGDGINMNGSGAGQPMQMEAFDREMGSYEEAMMHQHQHHAAPPPDPSAFLPSETSVGGISSLGFPQHYDFEAFNTFDDPFPTSYQARPPQPAAIFEPAPETEPFPDAPEDEAADNKLLSFSPPAVHASVVDENGRFVELGMTAELYGMFFVAEDVFGGETAEARPPLELTCYRRNLWQCSGHILLPRHVTHVINEQNRQVPILELAACITAVESIDGKQTEIISIPWKSANPIAGEDSKVAGAPQNIVLDLSAGQEVDGTRVSLPVAWKRLQFKHATANNGRRKGMQQHYVVEIGLLGKMKSGEYMKIAEIQSGAVIVRGRSPRNFDSKKEIALSGDKKHLERRNTTAAEVPQVKSEQDAQPPIQRFHSTPNVTGEWQAPQPSSYSQTPTPTPGPPPKKMAMTPSVRPPVPAFSRDSSVASWSTGSSKAAANVPRSSAATSVPINLSLSEDEKSPNRSNSETQSPNFPKGSISSQGQAPGYQSPGEDDELLYEYFPLTVDDWMMPVDAVYRPHIVHATVLPPEAKAQQTRGKSKRYFAD